MTKTKRIIVSVTTVAVSFAVLCTAGITLAASTSANRSKGSLTTPDLDLTAKAKNIKVYSAVKTTEADSAFGNAEIGFYKYEQSIVQGDVGEINFSNHDGGVVFDDKSVSINNVLPGDKVEFDIEVTSASSIAFNYRAELYVDSTEGKELLNKLEFSAGELGLVYKDISGETASPNVPVQAVLTDYTEWKTFSANKTNIETVHVTVSLPITTTSGQGESVKFYYLASGIQNTVSQQDVVRFDTQGGGTVGFKTVAEAVAYAKENGITEIPVVGSTLLEEGTVTVDDALHFVGVPDANENYPVLNGARFVIEGGASASFDKIKFTGASYIDVSRATALTLNNCSADITPVRYYDTMSQSYLNDDAFIVSGSTLMPVKLTVVNNTRIVSGKGAAISLRSPLANGSVISDSFFGTEERPYDGTAVLAFNGAYGTEPVISVKNNELYGTKALSLGGAASGTRYLVVSENNTAYGLANNIFADGTAAGALVDSGSRIGESVLQCANIAYGTLAFGGVDVSLNSINRITAGKIAVSEQMSMGDFFAKYVVGSILSKNAIELYNASGVHYAYLNSANNGSGYVIDVIGG